MENIPLVYIKNKKIYTRESKTYLNLKKIKKQLISQKKLYIKDLDGIEKDNSNLDIYQRLSNQIELWVDTGPRNRGDIIDLVTSGVKKIIVNEKQLRIQDIMDIKKDIESQIYLYYTIQKINTNLIYKPDIQGYIISNNIDFNTIGFNKIEKIKKLCHSYPVYICETKQDYNKKWETVGVTGLITDLKI